MELNDVHIKLTLFFNENIEYNGEMNLFVIDYDEKGLLVNFLNKSHYEFIVKNFKKELYSITGKKAKFSHFNLKASSVKLRKKTDHIKKIQKIELPTENNKTINKVIDFLYEEYDRIKESQMTNIEDDQTRINMLAGYGSISTLAKMLKFLNSIKDYRDS